ncbi:MAG: ASKHA domain-containing protein [Alphaproteobacteria bacterium]|nr:ASKHA domain-containing protein [Alphaproteobacteria bacterium]
MSEEYINDNPDKAFIAFMPSGQRGIVPKGISVLQAARMLDVDLDSNCSGNARCGRCQVEYSFGEFPKLEMTATPENISALSGSEERYHKRNGLGQNRRLACCGIIKGDLVVDVPPESQAYQQIISKKTDTDYSKNMQPMIELYDVTVEEASMHSQTGDSERVMQAMQAQHEISISHINPLLLRDLQKLLRANAWRITVAVKNDAIIGIWPPAKSSLYGIAVDLGSTTISAMLADLVSGQLIASAGRMNPQIRFGEDLMSRVSYAMMTETGTQQMSQAVRRTLNELIRELCAEHDISTKEIIDIAIVCNPVMHHILLNISPVELGNAPFALATGNAINIPAQALKLQLHECADAYILPCAAGHVGADAAAVMLALKPWLDDDNVLIVDVGTNAELTLSYQDNEGGGHKRLLSCSSPTGPALEGAQISSGQRAASGAIENVRINPETLEPRIKVIGIDAWSDEQGFADSDIGVTGICGSGIIEVIVELYLAGVITPAGIIDGRLAERTPRIVASDRTFNYLLHENDNYQIFITQNDVRAIQLAKGALYASARLLMDKVGITQLDRVILAGAFGSHIDPKYALILGMLPDCRVEDVSSAGNAAGTGALMALTSKDARIEIEQRIELVEKIETALDPDFQKYFVSAMGIPNSDDPYQKLSQSVTLPRPTSNQTSRTNRNRPARKRYNTA